MKMRNVFTKVLYEKRVFTLGWSIALGAMSLLVVVFYPSFKNAFDIEAISGQLPSQLQGLLGDAASYQTLGGYLGAQLFSVRMPLFMLILAIILGLSLTVAQEESGKLRSLISIPQSRLAIIWHTWASTVLIVGVISLVSALSVYIGAALIGEPVSHMLLWQLTGLLWLFGITACSIVIGLGAGIGKRSATTGVVLVVTIGSFILTTFGATVSWLEPWERLSLLHYFNASALAQGQFQAWHTGVLFAVAALCMAIGSYIFSRRDI